MNYQITSDNIDISESMKELARQKVQVLDNKLKHIPESVKSVRVVFNKVPEDKFEVTILFVVRKKEYFAEGLEYKVETALIKAVDHLERMFEKDKIMFGAGDWEEAREAKRYEIPDEDVESEE